MKVYIVTVGEYSDKYNVAVFTDKTSAENFAFNENDRYANTDIEEFDLSEDRVEKQVPKWCIYISKKGKLRGFFGHGSSEDLLPQRVPVSNDDSCAVWLDLMSLEPFLYVILAAGDAGKAADMAIEKYHEMIASGEWDRQYNERMAEQKKAGM